MKIGDEVYVHGYIDEIRNDVIIIRNEGGYFGTVPSEVVDQEETLQNLTKPNKSDLISRQAAIDAYVPKNNMNVLIACEESQRVCMAFRERGHRAYSCDILECSGGHPEWHINEDVLPLLDGNCTFKTADGYTHVQDGKWDMIIGFPPCTYLTVTGNRWFDVEKFGAKALAREEKRNEAKEFFMKFANADCNRIAIENPIGVMSTRWRKPNQIIHPYMFGDPARKATCLWLKGLPNLKPMDIVEPVIIQYKNGNGTDNPWHMDTMGLPPAERARARSKTFPGIAKAMAEQWG